MQPPGTGHGVSLQQGRELWDRGGGTKGEGDRGVRGHQVGEICTFVQLCTPAGGRMGTNYQHAAGGSAAWSLSLCIAFRPHEHPLTSIACGAVLNPFGCISMAFP